MHSIDVRCEVDADPAENIRFSWTYNNTRNVSPVRVAFRPQFQADFLIVFCCCCWQVLNSRITSNGLVSTMTYLAPTDSELTLACWASNAVGRQEIPCLIHIVPASEWLKQNWTEISLDQFKWWTCWFRFCFLRITRSAETLWTPEWHHIWSCL